jgi:nucleoside-diphosphate-sugar epimerase
LTLICLLVFSLSGFYTPGRLYFYTPGRLYRGRYKVVMVAEAVSVAYSLFAFVAYVTGWGEDLRRGTLVYAWILSVILLVVARLWASIWSNLVRAETPKRRPDKETIRNVLVIGGGGYIGSALLPKLLDRGYRVRLLDLFIYGPEAIKDVLKHPRLEIVQADFRQVNRVVEAMWNMDAVIHLGAIVGDPACALNEDLTVEVNLMATKMIAEVAKGSGVRRFIFASTCSVYGASDEILDENSLLNPVSLYARSKIASERVLMDMADSDFAPTILRFGTIYGQSGRTRFDLVVNLLTAKALIDGQITISGGDQWRPFVHVDDAASAVFKTLAATSPRIRNQVFNVGSDEQNYTISQVGELIRAAIPTAELIDMGADGDRRNYRASFGKIQRELQFRPTWSVEEGIQQVKEAIESGRILDYRDPKYSNVKFLSDEMSYHLALQEGWALKLINEGLMTQKEPVVSRSQQQSESLAGD